jgi:Transposase DDE domain/Insertion element 4 transposase N-terminal
MGFMVRTLPAGTNLTEELTVQALERAVPQGEIRAVAAAYRRPGQRRRKLPLEVLLLVSILMNLYTEEALARVLGKLYRGVRLLGPEPAAGLAGRSALCQGRARLGVRPVVALFHRVCQPLATGATAGACLFGLRVLGLDGTAEDVPDTPANERAFGRPRSGRGAGAFPQVKGVYLVECGTHAVLDAGFWPCRTSERVGGLRLLRSVGAGTLLLWDRGFHSFEMAARARAREAHFLGRVPGQVKLVPHTLLPDGSFWAWLAPSDRAQRRAGVRLRVRVLVYTLTDPARPGYGKTHRLITSLLDPRTYPARELIVAYHERWEVELTIDEIDTHQRLAPRPLRSQQPLGVLQELYGLLIAHYAVRAVMRDAARQARVDPDRISFVRAVSLLKDAISDFQLVTPRQHPRLYRRLLADLAQDLLPPRAQRTNPRVVKRKMSNFKLKRPAQRGLPPLRRAFAETVQILPAALPPNPDDGPAPAPESQLLLTSLI